MSDMSDIGEEELISNCQKLEEELNKLKSEKLSSTIEIFKDDCEREAES